MEKNKFFLKIHDHDFSESISYLFFRAKVFLLIFLPSYLDRDLGLAGALPHPQHLGALPPGLLVGGERGVAALGRSLALPHLEVLPHHQHQLDVLTVRHVAVLGLVTRAAH